MSNSGANFEEISGASGKISLNENAHIVSSSGATQTIPSIKEYTVNDYVLSSNCVFTMPAAPAENLVNSLTVFLQQPSSGGPYTATFTEVKWEHGAAPTLSTSAEALDCITFSSRKGKWYGFASGYEIR